MKFKKVGAVVNVCELSRRTLSQIFCDSSHPQTPPSKQSNTPRAGGGDGAWHLPNLSRNTGNIESRSTNEVDISFSVTYVRRRACMKNASTAYFTHPGDIWA